tara:strand:+ start:476 stop:652 length:177 start_codon:yes stop_codon:yes gene_type:complete
MMHIVVGTGFNFVYMAILYTIINKIGYDEIKPSFVATFVIGIILHRGVLELILKAIFA